MMSVPANLSSKWGRPHRLADLEQRQGAVRDVVVAVVRVFRGRVVLVQEQEVHLWAKRAEAPI